MDSSEPVTPRELIKRLGDLDIDESPVPASKSAVRSVEWLSDRPEDVAELATLLYEAAPRLHVERPSEPEPPIRIRRSKSQQLSLALRLRVGIAEPLVPDTALAWDHLCAAIPHDHLTSGMPSDQLAHTTSGDIVEVTSGGRVFFCILRLPGEAIERCVIVKFVPQRLQCQSEQFANELARLVGVAVPSSRIIRQAAVDGEWATMATAAASIRDAWPDFEQGIGKCSCALALEYIPGRSLFSSADAFENADAAARTAQDLGRIFVLDMLLGNADRLPNADLGWRGNPGNVLVATGGRWAGRVVALDAQVQRRPPGGKQSSEDAACERLAELSLNFQEVAGGELREATRGAQIADARVLREPDAELAFQAGVREVLESLQPLQGLLETMSERVNAWTSEFLADMESRAESGGESAGTLTPPARSRRSSDETPTPSPAGTPEVPSIFEPARSPVAGGSTPGTLGARALQRTTAKIRALTVDAHAGRGSDSARVARWEAIFKGRSRELRAAVAEWQARRRPESALEANWASDSGSRAARRSSVSRSSSVASSHLAGEVSLGSRPQDGHGGARPGTQSVGGVDVDLESSPARSPLPGRKAAGRVRWEQSMEGISSPQSPAENGCGTGGAPGDAQAEVRHPANGARAGEGSTNAESEGNHDPAESPWPFYSGDAARSIPAIDPPAQQSPSTLVTDSPQDAGGSLSTGFLDGVRAIVDVYELGVRLSHSLNRARVLGASLRTARPSQIEEGLFVGGAVAAASLHTLRHCGITHILNATTDLLLPEASAGFAAWTRVPLEDKEEENLLPAVEAASRFLDVAAAAKGSVLVHCHAGQSRSVSLILAWLMGRRHWTLVRTLRYVRASHPEASPNAGYLTCLLQLEESLIGTRSLRVRATKPRLRACPECGKLVGLSREAVLVHTRAKHDPEAAERLRRELSLGATSDASSVTRGFFAALDECQPPSFGNSLQTDASTLAGSPGTVISALGGSPRGVAAGSLGSPCGVAFRASGSPYGEGASLAGSPRATGASAGDTVPDSPAAPVPRGRSFSLGRVSSPSPLFSPHSHESAGLRSPRAHHAVIFDPPPSGCSRTGSIESAGILLTTGRGFRSRSRTPEGGHGTTETACDVVAALLHDDLPAPENTPADGPSAT